MSEDLLALAEKSAETDLAFLLKAKEEAKKRMNTNPNPENISAFNKARDAVDAEASRLQAVPSGRIYKTQLDAVAFLRDRGFKVSKSSFGRDLKAGKISTDVNGHFEEPLLLAYALALKEPTATAENKALSSATTVRLSADAELKKYQAERQKLKLEKEQGLLMPRSEHERDLAARALFFKKEVENFIHLYGPGIIHLVGGDENRLPDLVAHWETATADWMNAWSQEREYVVPDDADELEPDESGESAFAEQDSGGTEVSPS